MLFTSATFLFLFLPAVLLLYFSVRGIFLRSLLLLASIVFYLWGELSHAWIFGLLIVFNYFAAIAIDRLNEKEQLAGVRKKKIPSPYRLRSQSGSIDSV
jgi:alginate O-acetyltransferase complex protein AlgI